MRDDGHFDRVQDYTDAFLAMSALILLSALVLVWAAFGYLVALALCFGLHVTIGRLAALRAARDADWDARVDAVLARHRD